MRTEDHSLKILTHLPLHWTPVIVRALCSLLPHNLDWRPIQNLLPFVTPLVRPAGPGSGRAGAAVHSPQEARVTPGQQQSYSSCSMEVTDDDLQELYTWVRALHSAPEPPACAFRKKGNNDM